MKISAEGRAFIGRFEGLILHAYDDADPARRFIEPGDAVRGVLTIGFGHTKTAKPGMRITAERADALLHADLADAERDVGEIVKAGLTQYEFDALVSFRFNIGRGNFERSSVVRYINMAQRQVAATKFTLFEKQRINGVLTPVLGLRKRRLAERELFLHADYSGKP